jgi:hypothetical protein
MTITHGRIRACAIHETTVYSVLRDAMRTGTVHELQTKTVFYTLSFQRSLTSNLGSLFIFSVVFLLSLAGSARIWE